MAALASPVFAQDMGIPGARSPEVATPAQRSADFCEAVTLRSATMLGRMEAVLHLTAAQQPLYDEWRNQVFANIKTSEPSCTEPLPRPRDFLAFMRQEERIHQKRADALHAEIPPLAALRAALTDKQRAFLDKSVFQSRFAKARPTTTGGLKPASGDTLPEAKFVALDAPGQGAAQP